MTRPLAIAVAGLVLLGIAPSLHAQDSEQTQLQSKYEKKLAESWFVDNGFTADYDLARERARDAKKPIFAYFTRTYQP